MQQAAVKVQVNAEYLALGRGGWQMQKQLSKFVLSNIIVLYAIQPADYSRLFTPMEQYRDRPIDLADATLVLTAEKVGERRILRLDSDFLFHRINNEESFDIVSV